MALDSLTQAVGRKLWFRRRDILATIYEKTIHIKKKIREKSRECHNHKSQPFQDTKKKRKQTKPNKHKSKKRTKSTKISSLLP